VRRGWFAASGVFFAVFVASAYLASKLALLDSLGPGPGFFPLILGVLGAVLSLTLILQQLRQPRSAVSGAAGDGPSQDDLVPDRAAAARIVGLVVLLAAAFFALDPIGYRFTALAFTALVLLVLGARNLLVIAAVSLVLSFGVFHAFFYWLKVPLPVGMFGW
jgi:putative tricarboxylic transport membrane protein